MRWRTICFLHNRIQHVYFTTNKCNADKTVNNI